MCDLKFKNIQDIINFVNGITVYKPRIKVYRAVSNSNWDMKPSISRLHDCSKQYNLINKNKNKKNSKDIENYLLEIEKKILNTYRIESYTYLGPTSTEGDWFVLSHAQHHLAPTRLMDWTSDILCAIYFSVCEIFDNQGKFVKEKLKCDSAIYINAEATDKRINEIHFKPLQNSLIANYGEPYLFFRPPQFTERVRLQSGFFTIFENPYRCMKEDFIKKSNTRFRIIIERDSKINIYKELLQYKPYPNYSYMADYNSLSKDIFINQGFK